jgi:hypothetical protein
MLDSPIFQPLLGQTFCITISPTYGLTWPPIQPFLHPTVGLNCHWLAPERTILSILRFVL